jgi:hypothetical protein
VHPAQWLLAHEAFEPLDSEAEFAGLVRFVDGSIG